jgi:hypothetical protein
MSSSNNPTPSEIIALAKRKGFIESRSEVSSTLFFEESSPQFSMPPVRIHVYYTTRCVLTHLNHPTQGTNELWRSDAYQTLQDLEEIFDNPRLHTGKGYRRAKDAVRGCVKCGTFKKRGEFSKKQWDKGPDANKCKDCVAVAVAPSPTPSSLVEEEDVSVSELSDAIEGVHLGDEFPSLSEDLLRQHDKKIGAGKQKLERRQFNCPECPKQGRGKHVFFKKVRIDTCMYIVWFLSFELFMNGLNFIKFDTNPMSVPPHDRYPCTNLSSNALNASVQIKVNVKESTQYPSMLKKGMVISSVWSAMIAGEVLELFTTLDKLVMAVRRMGF